MGFLDCDEYVTTSTAKPIVECRLQSNIVLGQKVAIVPYNHPVEKFNGKQCLTGKSITVTVKNDVFETDQTCYVVV